MRTKEEIDQAIGDCIDLLGVWNGLEHQLSEHPDEKAAEEVRKQRARTSTTLMGLEIALVKLPEYERRSKSLEEDINSLQALVGNHNQLTASLPYFDAGETDKRYRLYVAEQRASVRAQLDVLIFVHGTRELLPFFGDNDIPSTYEPPRR